jgi:uncharacterized protein (TIGR02611 family)
LTEDHPAPLRAQAGGGTLQGGHPDGPSAPDNPTADDGMRSLRERVAGTRWRRRLAARRTTNSTYRLVVGILGGLVVAFGLVTIPLPGPGWLTVIAGLFLLATEFTWAERLLDFTRHHVKRWTDWVGARPIWVRVLLAVLTAAFVYGVVVVALHLTGVPHWVPGWVPLWR